MSDNWLEKQWAETDPRPRAELLAEIVTLRQKLAGAERERDSNALDGYQCGRKLADMEIRAEAAEARITALEAENARLRDALQLVMGACDQGRRVERGAGGMTVEAQLRRSVINGVPAWPIEVARDLASGAHVARS